MAEGITFNDVESRQVEQLHRGGSVVVIASTSEESHRNGSGSHAAFGQPVGLCTEGNNLFIVADVQNDTVKSVKSIRIF